MLTHLPTDPNDPLNPANLQPAHKIIDLHGKPIANVPSPEVRSEIALDAIKAVSPALLMEKPMSEQMQVHKAFEQIVMKVLTPFIQERREAVRNNFNVNSEKFKADFQHRLYQRIKYAFLTVSKDDLHLMLSTLVLTRLLEELDSIN